MTGNDGYDYKESRKTCNIDIDSYSSHEGLITLSKKS